MLTLPVFPGFPAVVCPSPEPIPHSTMVGNDTWYGSAIEYQCDKTYAVTSGVSVLHCLANATWSGHLPVCQSKSN